MSFGPGFLMGTAKGVGPFGVGVQVATISAQKAGYFTQDPGRSRNLMMTDSANTVPDWSTNCAGIVKAFEPHRLDYTLELAASLKGN